LRQVHSFPNFLSITGAPLTPPALPCAHWPLFFSVAGGLRFFLRRRPISATGRPRLLSCAPQPPTHPLAEVRLFFPSDVSYFFSSAQHQVPWCHPVGPALSPPTPIMCQAMVRGLLFSPTAMFFPVVPNRQPFFSFPARGFRFLPFKAPWPFLCAPFP